MSYPLPPATINIQFFYTEPAAKDKYSFIQIKTGLCLIRKKRSVQQVLHFASLFSTFKFEREAEKNNQIKKSRFIGYSVD